MKSYPYIFVSLLLFIQILTSSSGCKKSSNQPPPAQQAEVSWWQTTEDSSQLLKEQPVLSFNSAANNYPFIEIDTTVKFQSIDGFGYTLTGGSAMLLHRLPQAQRAALLQVLFGSGPSGIGISYLRVSIGASDLDSAVFSYNDLPPGETDPALAKFSLDPDRKYLIPILKEILAINPQIKILGSPWSAPVWMKDNGSSKGGSLKPEYYAVYARYFVKYIQQMKAEGIVIDAITPQNEPLHPGNNPSMYMTAMQQADFIKNHLGPAFKNAGLPTKIIIYDHNADRPDYPLTILNDAAAKAFVDGSAFHLYAGDITALSQVRNAHPDKNIYFTEQWTGAKGDFGGDLKWHLRNVIIGSMRNWSRIALEWNLANDPSFGPHTPGGCTECKGALTIGNGISRNVSYYIVAHASKFVPPASVRVSSNITANLHNVAFITPQGKKVLIVLNDFNAPQSFNVKMKGRWFNARLEPGAVATFVWQ